MGYGKDVYLAAQNRLNDLRKKAEEENARQKEAIYRNIPRLRAIETELAETGIDAARAALSGSQNTAAAIGRLRARNLSLQAERAELLTQNGLPLDALEIHYHCRVCRDSGFRDGRICECLHTILREEACRRANSGSPLPLTSFDDFELSFYPDLPVKGYGFTALEQMRNVYSYCRHYAENLGGESKNLLLIGGTGLGKTHLALAIANRAISRGCGVVYDTAQNIFLHFEEEYFGHQEKSYTFSVMDCDLLVVDDLGSEFTSPYTVSALYNIINTRTLARKPIIVSTNLRPEELAPRYNDRIVSRLIGEFHMLMFFGKDVRQLKLQKAKK